MTFPAKFFLAFVGFALLAIAGGYSHSAYLGADLGRAITACEEQRAREQEGRQTTENRTADAAVREVREPGQENGPWDKYKQAPLVCDAEWLYGISLLPDAAEATGVQRYIILAYRAKVYDSSPSIGFMLAAVLLIVGSVPVIWYFFLRRVGELAAAVRGK